MRCRLILLRGQRLEIANLFDVVGHGFLPDTPAMLPPAILRQATMQHGGDVARSIVGTIVKKLLASKRGRGPDARAVHASPAHRLLARVLAATVPRNASGNNASVR